MLIDLPVGGPCDLGSDAGDLEDELDSFLSIGEASATEVVFVKEHVSVWPSRKHRIQGRLSLVKQHCVLFMSWLPYAAGVLRDDGSFESEQIFSKKSATDSSSTGASGTSADRSLYAIHPINLTEIRLLRAHTPVMGPHRLDITLISGVTLPPLHLPAPAILHFIQVVKQHVSLVASGTMKGTWLVNETADALVRSLSALDLDDVLLGGPPRGGAHLTWAPPAPPPTAVPPATTVTSTWASWITQSETIWDVANAPATGGVFTSSPFIFGGDNDAPLNNSVSSASPSLTTSSLSGLGGLGRSAWRVLSTGLQRLVAEFPTTSLGSFITDGDYGLASAAPQGEVVPRVAIAEGKPDKDGRSGGQQGAIRIRSGQRAAARAACMAVGILVPSESMSDAGSALNRSTLLAQSAKNSSAGRMLLDTASPPCTAFRPLLLSEVAKDPGPDGAHLSVPDVAAISDSCNPNVVDDEYELVERHMQTLCEAHLKSPALPPLTEDDLRAMMDSDGRLPLGPLRERCWASGLDPAVRRLAWPLLLGLRKPSETRDQYKAAMEQRRRSYSALCQQWQARIRAHDPSTDRAWWESCSRIDKDVCRTDRAHPVFAKDECLASKALRRMLLSYVTQANAQPYCQGMGDLAAPLLVVLVSESEAFAAFNALMTRLGGNFDVDQQGMHAQLAALRRIMQLVDPPLHAHLEACDCLSYFFAFRWLLIHFKREFRYEDVLRLWEALWCAPTGPHMHLYLAAAIMVHHRKAILTQVVDFDSMLKFCIQLSQSPQGLELRPLLLLGHVLATYVGPAADDVLPAVPPFCASTSSPTK